MKTRTNQPVILPSTADIEHLSDTFLNQLKAGDIITKETNGQKHAYIVTYKQEQHGICLSYFDGSGYIETISYDYTDGHWVFNSKDVFNASDIKAFDGEIKISSGGQYDRILTTDMPSKSGVYKLVKDVVGAGKTIQGVVYHDFAGGHFFIGVYNDKFISTYSSSGAEYLTLNNSIYLKFGTQLYRHHLSISRSGAPYGVDIFTTSETSITYDSNSQHFIIAGDTIGLTPANGASYAPMLLQYIATIGGTTTFDIYVLDTSTGTFSKLSATGVTDTVTAI